MKNIFYVFLILAFVSCKDDNETSSVLVNLNLTYDGQPLKMFNEYTYPTGEVLYFSRFAMFTSDIQLKEEDGKYINIADIKYHDLTNSHTGNNTGYSFSIDDIKTGDYKAIKFSLGVQSDYNAKTPANFDASNPLSNQSEYWGGWQSYIFTRTEGKIDFNNDGEPETGFALHTGANSALRTVELPVNVTIKSNNTPSIIIEIDLKKEFGQNPVYDIKTNPQIHSLAQQPQVIELIDNLIEGISIQ